MYVIETKNLSYYYSKGESFENVGVKDINIAINKNQIIGIIGHTGSGKSTLAQLFNGLIKPSKGKVLLNGKDLWSDFKNIRDVHFKVGLTFQYPENQLFAETLYKDIAFGAANQGLDKHEIDKRVIMAMDFVGLDYKYLDSSPFDLSGGEKRRAAIAGIIAMRPEVIILDEPTAGLDPVTKEDLLDKIYNYHKKTGNVMIFISHIMEDIARICDKVMVLDKGNLVMFDTTRNVFKNYKLLNKIGLDVPQITRIMRRIYEKGFGENKCVINVDEATNDIINILHKKKEEERD